MSPWKTDLEQRGVDCLLVGRAGASSVSERGVNPSSSLSITFLWDLSAPLFILQTLRINEPRLPGAPCQNGTGGTAGPRPLFAPLSVG